MAKLTLDNGTTLYIKAHKGSEGVEIKVSETKDGDDWYLATITHEGALYACADLEGTIPDGLQYDENGAIKVEKSRV